MSTALLLCHMNIVLRRSWLCQTSVASSMQHMYMSGRLHSLNSLHVIYIYIYIYRSLRM